MNKSNKFLEDKYLIDKFRYDPLVVPPSIENFTGTDELEPLVCSRFGCRKKLTHEESLYGSLCIHHQPPKN